MNLPIVQLILFLVSFVLVWIGAGFVIDTISALAMQLKISRFMLAFFVLGMLTSMPEIVIGTFSAIQGEPQVFVGNLIGGIIIILLCVIPLLAIFGNGVASPWRVSRNDLLLILGVILSPSLFLADQRITQLKAIVLILLYVLLFAYFAYEQSFFEKVLANIRSNIKPQPRTLISLIIGLSMLLFGGYQIVQSTTFFASYFSLSPFFVSLIAVSLGSNIPEISLIIRSIRKSKKDVALAGYLGSAAANVPLLGIFSLMFGEDIILPDHFIQRIFFTAAGAILFFRFSGTQKKVSPGEGLILFLLYIIFLVVESFLALRWS